MMKIFILHTILIRMILILLVTAVFTPSAAASEKSLRNVLVVSIDALHPAALGPETTPVIQKLISTGAYTADGHSTNPPLTLISHAAMFTGLVPGQSGKNDNNWEPGRPAVGKPTIFNTAKKQGFHTGFFYSKTKLGYLVNDAIDEHKLSEDFAVEDAAQFFEKPGRHFVFLHISGLDYAGPTSGWLSPEYMEELLFIDETLESLIKTIRQKGDYLIIITSDHAGHGTMHGTDHPEDAKLPLVMASDQLDIAKFQDIRYNVTELKGIIDNIMGKNSTCRAEAPDKEAVRNPKNSEHNITVYYFHRTMRCPSCLLLEELTKEAVTSKFDTELKSGTVRLLTVNLDETIHTHFIEDYGLSVQSVVVSVAENGKEKQWKRLDRVWELLHEEPMLIEYIQEEIHLYMKG